MAANFLPDSRNGRSESGVDDVGDTRPCQHCSFRCIGNCRSFPGMASQSRVSGPLGSCRENEKSDS